MTGSIFVASTALCLRYACCAIGLLWSHVHRSIVLADKPKLQSNESFVLPNEPKLQSNE
eukprot:SAG31_NODE_937_length_10886_cov_3.648651_3_plen_59_part_00